jgi:hypothetical protein
MPAGFGGLTDTYWNGQRVVARRLKGTVGESPSGWWCSKLKGQIRQVVEVTYYDMVFYIDNQDGSGWIKVTEGRGMPDYPHKSLPISKILEGTV